MPFKNIAFIVIVINSYSLCMETSTAQFVYSPETTKFLWDFHKVIVDYDIKEMSQKAYKNISCLSYLIRPYVIYQCMKSMYTRGTGGEWGEIAKYYPLFSNAIMEIGNSVTPIKGTVQILQKLSHLGYEQDLCSDINTEFLKNLEHNDSIQALLQLFKNKKSVDSSKPNAIFKYDIRYFLNYQQEYNKENKHLIFIDDWHTNLVSAKHVGIEGILFETPELLEGELRQRGIFTKKR